MTRAIFGTAAAAAAFTIAAAALAQDSQTPAPVILLIDSHRIAQDCTACKWANTVVESTVTQARRRAQQIDQSLQVETHSLQEQAQANDSAPSGARKTAVENALLSRAQQLDRARKAGQLEVEGMQQNIDSARENVSRQVSERLKPVMNQLMAAHRANLILDVDATLAHWPSIDATNEALSMLNSNESAIIASAPSRSQNPLQIR
jgi:Skp family chaperone for outer membrane proteins